MEVEGGLGKDSEDLVLGYLFEDHSHCLRSQPQIIFTTNVIESLGQQAGLSVAQLHDNTRDTGVAELLEDPEPVVARKHLIRTSVVHGTDYQVLD